MKHVGHVTSTDVASSIPFDNANNGYTATDVQAAIEELNTSFLTTSTPSFSWGKSGNINNPTYLLNDTVPSNISGRTVLLNGCSIIKVTVACEGLNTFDISIIEHDQSTYTTLATLSIVNQRSQTFTTSIPLTTGKQIAVQLSGGNSKNLVVGMVLRGTS